MFVAEWLNSLLTQTPSLGRIDLTVREFDNYFTTTAQIFVKNRWHSSANTNAIL